MARVTIAATSVHKNPLRALQTFRTKEEVGTRGSVLLRGSAPLEFTIPGFTLGFTPNSRSTSIALNHPRSDRFAHGFNAKIAHGLTPSHSIHIPTALLRRGPWHP